MAPAEGRIECLDSPCNASPASQFLWYRLLQHEGSLKSVKNSMLGTVSNLFSRELENILRGTATISSQVVTSMELPATLLLRWSQTSFHINFSQYAWSIISAPVDSVQVPDASNGKVRLIQLDP